MALKAGYKGLTEEQFEQLEQLQNLGTKLTCTEESEGSYVLTATVDSEGEVTYSWESAE